MKSTTAFCCASNACSCNKGQHIEGIASSKHGVPGKSPAATKPSFNNEKPVVSDKNVMAGSSTSRMTRGLAALGAMVLLPAHGIVTRIAGTADFVEIACSSTTALSGKMMEEGFEAKRINFLEGYDLFSGTKSSSIHLGSPGHPFLALVFHLSTI